ncbi:MAG TPA: GAF domain-containing protein [Aggregatilineales bacterium]|nr:GAF domain-containing protein [Anaerolineales bacterium]HRE47011.1 GAF domain-containing protein [Aggregatilineales bacterium]
MGQRITPSETYAGKLVLAAEPPPAKGAARAILPRLPMAIFLTGLAVLIPILLFPKEQSLPLTGPTVGGILFYALMYAGLSLLSFRVQAGIYTGFQNVAPMALFLSFGEMPTLTVCFLGAALFEVGRGLLGKRLTLTQHTLSQAVISCLFNGGASAVSTLLAGWLYARLGGELPAITLLPSSFSLFILLFFARALLYVTIILLCTPLPMMRGSQRLVQTLFRFFLIELFAMPIALLEALSLNDGQLPGFILLSMGSLLIAALFRSAESSRRELEQRIEEMATINRIGQALSATLAPEDLMQKIYEQIHALVGAPLFYIALVDHETDVISFPLAMFNGIRQAWEPRQMTNGITEYVIRTGKPLFIQGTIEDVRQRLIEMGMQPFGSGTVCFAAVPLRADNETFGVISIQSNTDPNAFGEYGATVLATVATQAAAALRNANLYNRVYEMADKLALLNHISSLVNASLDLQTVLHSICNVVIEVGFADKVGVFLNDESESALRLAYSIGLGEDFTAQLREISRGDRRGPLEFLRRGEPMAIANVHSDPRGRGWRTLAEVEGYMGLMAVPLVTGAQGVGFLAVFYTEAHTFTQSELEIMSTLANQVVAAIANARLHRDTQNRAGQLTQLYESSRMFNASLDLVRVTETVFDALARVAAPNALSLQLIDPDGSLRCIGARGIALESITPASTSAMKAIRSAAPITLPQNADDVEMLRRAKIHHAQLIPMISGETVFGLILIGHETEHSQAPGEGQLIEAMVNQAASAIRNAQLFNQMDMALEQRVNELTTIELISRKISGALDLDSVIGDVLNAALNATGADLAGIALRLPESPDRLSLVERQRGVSSSATVTALIDAGRGIIGRTLREKHMVHVHDVRHDNDYLPSAVPGIRTQLCVPILQDNTAIGAISLESRTPNAFGETHERFITNLTAHAAIAIHNAQLFEERDTQIGTLVKLRNFSLELISATTIRDVLDLIAEYTLIISHAKDVHIYLYENTEDRLQFSASLWLDGRQNVEAKHPNRRGRTYQVARDGKMLLIPDIRQFEPTLSPDNQNYTGIARLPIKRGDRVIGVMVITYRDVHHFTDIDIRLFELITGQAAIAIENARLFDEVRLARDRMKLVLDWAQNGVILVDAQGRVALVNPAAEHLLGYPLGKMTGKNILRVAARAPAEIGSPNIAFWKSQLQNILQTIRATPSTPTRREYSFGGKQPREIEETTLPVFTNEGRLNGRLIVLRDITEEKALKEMQESLTRMVHHDLLSPLGNIQTSVMMAKEIVQLIGDADLETLLDVALSSTQDGRRLVDTLLDINKLQEGALIPRREVCNLHHIAEGIVNAKLTLAKAEDIRLLSLVPADVPLITADTELIRRVLTNLVENALRHTPKNGEVRLETALLPPSAPNDEPALRISVTDTGKGVPPDYRTRIFEMFVQVPGSNIRGRRGSGIGLTFCRLAVEAHGGRIWVDSGPEGGARFAFRLPLIPRTHVEEGE